MAFQGVYFGFIRPSGDRLSNVCILIAPSNIGNYDRSTTRQADKKRKEVGVEG